MTYVIIYNLRTDASYQQSSSQAARGKRQGVLHLSCDANGNAPEAGCISPVAALAQVLQQALYYISPSLCILQGNQA